MNVLVTGGAGFIGSHFLDLVLTEYPNGRATVIDALTYAGDGRNLERYERDERLSFIRADVADEPTVAPRVAEADVVVHFAAESFVDRSIKSVRPFVHSNVLGTQSVLDACRASDTPLVYVSTDEVYGSIREGVFTEESPLQPNNPYAATKASADLLCRSYHHTYGTDVRIVRGTNAFGPRQHPEKAIPTFAIAALERRALPVYGDGSNRREWLFVVDFARAVLVVMETGESGGVYNAGGGHEVANVDLAREICRMAGADEALVEFVPDRPGHDFRYSMSWDRLARLGWKPEAEFDTALYATVRWYRKHPERRKAR